MPLAYTNQKNRPFGLWFVVCGSRQWLESATPHHQRRLLQRGRWHCQKDKNRSPSAKNQTRYGRDTSRSLIMWYYIEYQSFGADAKYRVPTMQNRFGRFDTTSFQEIILLSGVFRRETASGFYPWCNVEGPRKRVAEGLCGWRHGNSFPMTQSAQSHRQMRSIPRCSKAVFYVFVFLIPFTIRQQCILYPQKFSTEPK